MYFFRVEPHTIADFHSSTSSDRYTKFHQLCFAKSLVSAGLDFTPEVWSRDPDRTHATLIAEITKNQSRKISDRISRWFATSSAVLLTRFLYYILTNSYTVCNRFSVILTLLFSVSPIFKGIRAMKFNWLTLVTVVISRMDRFVALYGIK